MTCLTVTGSVETGLVHSIIMWYTEGVACGYHKVEHLRLRIYSLHSTILYLILSLYSISATDEVTTNNHKAHCVCVVCVWCVTSVDSFYLVH